MDGSRHFSLRVDENFEDSHTVRSLQVLCRAVLLQCITLERTKQVASLPLPSAMKSFLCTFRIPGDFDLDGLFLNYNFCFPNHVHHKTHQVHPARCVHDETYVLIKYLSTKDECSKCSVWGDHTMRCVKEREIWLRLRHDNLMNCFFAMADSTEGIFCYVLDFPVMSLRDFSWRFYCAKRHLPEYILWQILRKLASVLLFLDKNNVSTWELCQPHHVVIDGKGELKLENKLLYLPLNGGINFQTEYNGVTQALYSSPELKSGLPKNIKTSVWGIGSILLELTSTVPANLVASFGTNGGNMVPCIEIQEVFSNHLRYVILQCRSNIQKLRPSLEHLESMAEEKVSIFEDHYGYRWRSLLHLLPT